MVHGAQSDTESEQKSNYSFNITSKIRLVRLIVVQSSVGQKMFSIVDNILWTAEKCAEWSLPSHEVVREDQESNLQSEYVRPLPWYLFLPTLVLIRTIRMSLNGVASIMGYSKITPHKMVSFIQRTRRRIYAIQINGSKNRQDSKDKRLSMHEARKALIRSIRLTLSTLSCLDASKPSLSPPPTRIHVNNAFGFDVSSQSSTLKARSTPELLELRKSPESPESTCSTLKETSQFSLLFNELEESTSKLEIDESLTQMIDRLASESSTDDQDFELDCRISSNPDDDSTSVNTSSNISMNELTSIIEEANEIYNNKYNEPNANQNIKQDITKEDKQIFEDSFDNTSKSEIKQTQEEIEQLEQNSEKAIKEVKQISEKTTEDVEQTSEKTTEDVEQTSEKATEEVEQTSEEATKQEPEEDIERPSSEGSHAKVDDHLTSSRSHDSLVCCASDPSSLESDVTFYSTISSDSDTSKEQASSATTADKIAKTNQFINGEVRFVSGTMISEPKSCEGTNNGAVVEKRNTNVSKIHRGKRTSHGNRKKK